MQPNFHVTTSFAFDDTTYSDEDVITDADGPILKTVNGLTALQYLREKNILASEESNVKTFVWVVPAILTFPNGLRVVRAFISKVEGTEYIFATGALQKGVKIKFSVLDGDKTLQSAAKLVEDLCQLKENDMLAYSCGARAWSLGADHSSEAKVVHKKAEEFCKTHNIRLNYSTAYAGGEICPIIDNTGKLVNALHNYTLIVCTFNKTL